MQTEAETTEQGRKDALEHSRGLLEKEAEYKREISSVHSTHSKKVEEYVAWWGDKPFFCGVAHPKNKVYFFVGVKGGGAILCYFGVVSHTICTSF